MKLIKEGDWIQQLWFFFPAHFLFRGINFLLSLKSAKHRKRSGNKQPKESESSGSGLALAVGALIDGIPESVVIGLSMLKTGAVSTVAVIAIFLSNLPEGLSSTDGMKKAGRSVVYVFTVWGSISFISGLSSLAGFTVFKNFSPDVIATSTAFAAGAILSMIVNTMIPEAFEETHNFAGLITVTGFLIAFFLRNYNRSSYESFSFVNTGRKIFLFDHFSLQKHHQPYLQLFPAYRIYLSSLTIS